MRIRPFSGRTLTFSLNEKLALKGELVGGKGAGLARLYRMGFPVPPAIIISASAFREYLEKQLAEFFHEKPPVTQDVLDKIQKSILASDLSLHLKNTIKKGYEKIGGRVAVRSSLKGEDSLVRSFAGQLDTLLDVEGEENVIDAVKRCFSSCFNWRFWRYMQDKTFIGPRETHGDLSMAVIIQRMVYPEAAGVAFSIDPVKGKKNIIIEASCGLGDKVVQGQTEPDRYVLNEKREIQEITSVDPHNSVLERPNIETLANLVGDIASRLGGPQDIEWAYDGKDFFILQTRPVTAIHTERIYSSKLVSDMCPGLIKPLLWSTKYRSMVRHVFGRIFRELLPPIELDFARFIIRIHSRVYADMTGFGSLFEKMGLPSNFFEMMIRGEKGKRHHFAFKLKRLPALFRIVRVCWRYSRSANEISGFVGAHNKELDIYRRGDWSQKGPIDLLNHFDSLLHLHSKSQWYMFIGPMNMAIRNKIIGRLMTRSATDIDPGSIISGLVDLKALEPNRILREIAASTKKLHPEQKTVLMNGMAQEIREILLQNKEGQDLVFRVDEFLQRYGFLSANGTDFSEIPWVENPTFVWRSIARMASLPDEAVDKNVVRNRIEKVNHFRKTLSLPRRLFFDRLLKTTTKYIQLREQTSFIMSEETYLMRRQLLTLADLLAEERKIEQESDLFYLYYDELSQLVRNELDRETARERIAERKKEMEEDKEIDLPEILSSAQISGQIPSNFEDQDYLTGISASTGRIQGYARIIEDPTMVESALTEKDILIVPFTDVGWTPLLQGVGGIVAETGGVLSHTAIIAREYAMPAVVSVKRATKIIKDKQPLSVDGDAGRVYLKHQ